MGLRLSLVVAILGLVLGCNGSGQRIGVNHDLTGSTASQKNSGANGDLAQLAKNNPDCLPLGQLIDKINKSPQLELSIYLSNHDVGTESSNHSSSGSQITPYEDKGARYNYILKTKAISLVPQALFGPDLDNKTLLGDLLNVDAQKECDSIIFNNTTDPNAKVAKVEFEIVVSSKSTKDAKGNVTGGAPGILVLENPQTQETRTYRLDSGATHLHISVRTVAQLSSGLTEERDYIVNLGDLNEPFKIMRNFATLLKESLVSPPKELVDQLATTPQASKPGVKADDRVQLSFPSFVIMNYAITHNEFSALLK